MANGMVPYTKESGVATFVDVEKWKSFGLNKSFSEQSTPAMPGPGPGNVDFKLSDHQQGHAEGKLLEGGATNKGH